MVALPEPMLNICLGFIGSTFVLTIPVFRGTKAECDEYVKRIPHPKYIASMPPVTEIVATMMTDEELNTLTESLTKL